MAWTYTEGMGETRGKRKRPGSTWGPKKHEQRGSLQVLKKGRRLG